MKSRITLLPMILLLVACDQNAGRVEDAAKRNVRTSRQTPSTQAPTQQTAPVELVWTVPDGWVEQQPSSAMRKAQFHLPSPFDDGADANVVVFYFEGQGGGVDENLERWYSQFKQPDGRSSKSAGMVTNGVNAKLKHTLLDLRGTYLFKAQMMGPVTEEREKHRMLASIIETDSGPWFVKLVGPEGTVDYWRVSFLSFASSFRVKT